MLGNDKKGALIIGAFFLCVGKEIRSYHRINKRGDKRMEPFGYFAKDVAAELEITTSSLRRWSIELEKLGYIFERNEKEQRIYYERDFKAFRELKKLLSNSVPFVDATKAVASMDVEQKNAGKTPSVYREEIRLSQQELQEIIQQSVKEAIEEEREVILHAIDRKMNDVVERRDRWLTQQFKESMEQKQLEIAAANEIKKKHWWQFWQ